MSNRILNAVNSNGTFSYNSNGCFSTNNKNTSITSKNDITLNSTSFLINTNTLNLNIDNIINIISKNNTNNAILLESSAQNSGITIKTHKEGEVNVLSGDINLNASNGNISLGQKCKDNNLENLTQSVSIDALRKVSINTEDFYTIASDSINFISQTGDITFGSQIGESFIKFENNNILINQQTSSSNRILDIHVNKADNLDNNNGILIYSSEPDINSNIKIENDTKSNLQIGLTSSQSNDIKNINHNGDHNEDYRRDYNIDKTLIGYQKDNTIYLKTFIDDVDVNKTIVWENDKSKSLLIRPIKYVLEHIIYKGNFEINARLINSNVKFTDIKTTNCKDIIGIIIIIHNKDKFNWGYLDKNNNVIFNFDENNNKNIEINKEPFILDNIEITFPTTTGYNIGDYWKVSLIQTIQTSTKNNIPIQNCFTIKNNVGFISTSNNELQLTTSNKNRMSISSEGGISFNNNSNSNNITPHSFNISNSLNKEQYVSIEGTYVSQTNHQIHQLEKGGYVIIWEEKYEDYSYIFLKQYNADGNSNSKKQMVNTTRTGFHQQPHISNYNNSTNSNSNSNSDKETFIIVWSKKETLSHENNNNNNNNNNIYNLYAQIFIDYKKKKGFDIPLGSIYNNKNVIDIKSSRLHSGNFVIVWCGEDNDIGHFTIYGLILDIGGNIIKNRFQISETNSPYSYLNPIIYNTNTNYNYIVLYNTKNNELNNELNNQIIYDVKYKILNENNIKSSQHHLLSSYNYGTAQLLDNSLYITVFEPLFLNDNLNDKTNQDDNYRIISINHYDTVDINITINNMKDNIIKVSSEDLSLLNENDIICIENKSNTNSYSYNAKIALINREQNIIVLSKTTLNLSLYKFNLIENKLIFNRKKHNIHNNNTTVLNINTQERLFCDLSSTINNDICVVWGSEKMGVFFSLLSNNLESKIYNNQIFNTFRGVSDIKIKQLFSKTKNDSGLILSYIVNDNDDNNSNIMYKCIDLYNDIFRVNNYKNGISINHNGCLRIGKCNNEYNKYNDSQIHINGSFSSKITTIFNLKKYIVSHNDNTILVDASNNDVDIILDNNHTYYGRKYIVKHIKGDYKVIIKTSSLIDGKNNHILNNQWDIMELQSNGKEWYII